MNFAIIMHYTREKVNVKGFTWNGGRAIILSDLASRILKLGEWCCGKQKHCWVNCNFTGLFVLDNSCEGGEGVANLLIFPLLSTLYQQMAACAVGRGTAGRTALHSRGLSSGTSGPGADHALTQYIAPSISDMLPFAVPLWLSFSIWVVDFSDSFPRQLGKSSGQQHLLYMQDTAICVVKL